MAQPLEATMPEGLQLPDGYRVIFRALNPTTGADVGGVTVRNAVIFASNLGGGPLDSGKVVANPLLMRGWV